MSVDRRPVPSTIELTTDDLEEDLEAIEVDVDEVDGLLAESAEHEVEPTSRRAARRGTAPLLSPWRRVATTPHVAIADAVAAELRDAFARAPQAALGPLPPPRLPEPRNPAGRNVDMAPSTVVAPSVAPVALASVAPAPVLRRAPSRWPTRMLAGVTVLLAAAAFLVRLTAVDPPPVAAAAPPPPQELHAALASLDPPPPAPSVVAFDEPVAITVARPSSSLRALMAPPLTLGPAPAAPRASARPPSRSPAASRASVAPDPAIADAQLKASFR